LEGFAGTRGKGRRGMAVSKIKDGKLLIKIGNHWITEDDTGEVFRRLNENNRSVVYSDQEKEDENEKVLDEYDYCK
jgi:hypothetical protein